MTVEYKRWIISELENWAKTFNNNYPNQMEEVIKDNINNYCISLTMYQNKES